MVNVGYARVSTSEQREDSQTDSLGAAGYESIFTNHASGTLSTRPALTGALAYLRAGDTLVTTKLDRLGRSVKNLTGLSEELDRREVGLRVLTQGIDATTPGGRLSFHMLAAIAEFGHSLIVERTTAGLATASERGRRGRAKPRMTPAKIRQARTMYASREHRRGDRESPRSRPSNHLSASIPVPRIDARNSQSRPAVSC